LDSITGIFGQIELATLSYSKFYAESTGGIRCRIKIIDNALIEKTTTVAI